MCRKSLWKRLAAGMVIVCLTQGAMAGCGKGKYEKIGETAVQAQTEATAGSDSVQDSDYASDQAKADIDIVIEADGAAADGTGMGADGIHAGGTGTGGTGTGGAGAVDSDAVEPGAVDSGAGSTDGSAGHTGKSAESKEDGMHLLFAGDVLLSDHVLWAYEGAGGIEGVLDEGFREIIADTDFFFVNEEFPFSNRGSQAPDKQFTFRLPPEKVRILWQMGVDGVSLANNHALDYGTDALLDSCEVLDNAGILHTGAGADLAEAKQAVTVTISGKKIAIIGATRVIPVYDWAAGANHPGMLATYDPSVLLGEISKLREENDYVIVYVHWGIEKDEMPQEYQRTLGQQYIDAGADLVIGAHPHVLQGIEYYKGKAIVYSLGNFVFGNSIPRTALLEVTEDMKLRLIPGTSSAGYTKRITDPEQCREFYQHMEEISFGVKFLEDGTVAEE